VSRDTFDTNQLKNVMAKLDAAPPPAKKLSKTAAIRELEPKIRELQEKGHTIESIATLLTQAGIPTSMATLQSALKKTGTGKKGRPKKVQAPVVPLQAAAPVVSARPHKRA
jgi:hypothetical protein